MTFRLIDLFRLSLDFLSDRSKNTTISERYPSSPYPCFYRIVAFAAHAINVQQQWVNGQSNKVLHGQGRF